jgi:hypothetical protein
MRFNFIIKIESDKHVIHIYIVHFSISDNNIGDLPINMANGLSLIVSVLHNLFSKVLYKYSSPIQKE